MILAKTDLGQRVLRDRSIALAPRQRSAFILFDGHRSTSDVLQATEGGGLAMDDITAMVDAGLLIEAPDARTAIAEGVSDARNSLPIAGAAPDSGRSAQERYQAAYLIATELTAGLGLRGLPLTLALEGAGSFDDLVALEPRIRQAVGSDKSARLARALHS